MDWRIIKANAAIELQRRQIIDNYAKYVEHVHEGRWIVSKHLSFLCDEIQRFIEANTGNPYDILILQMPPQHGKSMTTTETLPSWYLGKYPQKRVIEISYNEDFAQLFGRRNRNKLKQFGESLFNVKLAAKPNSDTEFELDNNIGGMISRGVLSGVTGRPADLMIIDDPVKNRQEAESETYRNRVWDEWLNSFKTRLAAGAKVIVIMTRWHEDDLAGRIIQNEKHVKVINLPCEAEENDPIGRKPGEALFPEIGKDTNWLREFKQGYMTEEGSRAWNALYQGRPTAQEGNLIKRSWWKYYTELPQIRYKIITVDATFKDADNSDYVVIQAWGKHLTDFYLIDQIRAKMSFTETIKAINTFNSKHKDRIAIYIEDKANGTAIIDVLSRSVSGVIAYCPKDPKEVRAQAIMPLIEAGNVYLPQYEAFTQAFVDECAAFPNGTNDDQVDAMAMGLQILKNYIDTPPQPKVPRESIFKTQSNVRSDLDIWS
jgi:predicted phage terminase large subunit-like protein